MQSLNELLLEKSSLPILNCATKVDSTLLITGESGTGKTRLARFIHNESTRRSKKWVSINLATLSSNLIESELFGHEKGAFSGADTKRQGRLELAQGGTVFLDEIGELPSHLQCKLLDFIQTKSLIPVGGNREIKVDVRIIAATNQNLERLVLEKRFREDLFYRLNVFHLRLSPLRKNKIKIAPIAAYLLKELNSTLGTHVSPLSSDVIQELQHYAWPGNIRELRNKLELWMALTRSGEIPLSTLNLPPSQVSSYSSEVSRIEIPPEGLPIQTSDWFYESYYKSKEAFERAYLAEILKRFDGKINETARRAKISKVTLIEKIRRYGIETSHFKPALER